jgi:tRNA uridine 5-carbamoylmethylation protein Kti12
MSTCPFCGHHINNDDKDFEEQHGEEARKYAEKHNIITRACPPEEILRKNKEADDAIHQAIKDYVGD